ncbi:MAG: hypothetical protein RMK29_07005 [Myxococcales bacterium]|nr:hypothetical protein [Myxococcota bacterium]MDW8281442.1 hypothetical protein [Myxococcales bacterium]
MARSVVPRALLLSLAGWALLASAAAAPPGLVVPTPAEVPAEEPPPAGSEAAPPAPDVRPRFLGGAEADDDVLARLCSLPLRSIGPLGGGASITLKAVFVDGSQAAVKPDQLHVTRYYAEVAAYRVARALGIDRVAPSCVRYFPREVLMHPGMPRSLLERMQAELRVDDEGLVAAAVIQWIPNLRSLRLEKKTWWQPLLRRGAPWPRDPDQRRRLLEISTMLLYDFIIGNDDRWSGGNTHVTGDRMVYLDQGAAFGRDSKRRRAYVFSRLRQSERFERKVAEALWDLDVVGLQRELAGLLSVRELRELTERIREAQQYLRRLHEEAPEDSLY